MNQRLTPGGALGLSNRPTAKGKRGAKREVCVYGSHDVVGHDTDTARQPLEAISWIRFDHIEEAKPYEPDERPRPGHRDQEERYEHAHHFVDDHRPRVGRTKVALCG